MASSVEKRKYEHTHPWITFQVDTRTFDHDMWLLLGEAKSKCEHIIRSTLLPEVQERLMNVFLVKGANATTAIEGNTLTEEEVRKRIGGQLELPISKEYLGKEIDNIVEAYNLIGDKTLQGATDKISIEMVKEYNRLVLKNLPIDEGVIPGEIRTYQVVVANYLCAPPEDCPYLFDRLISFLNDEFIAPKGKEMIYGFLKAIVAHLYLAWIHPFGDGNGRTARLIEFQILLSVGVPNTAAHLLSNHYNQTRSEYYRNLDITSKSNGDIAPFIKYALQGFVDQLKSQIDMIRIQQVYVHWIYYIHETFRNMRGTQGRRRRDLVLELTQAQQPIPLSGVRRLSARTAEMYVNLTDRTIQRDIEKLTEMELIVKTKEGLSPNWDLMSAFLPLIRSQE